jgi:hypothetical protein
VPEEDNVPKLPPPPTAQEVKSQNLLEKKKKKTKAEKPAGPIRPPSEPAVIQPTPSEPVSECRHCDDSQ